MSSVYYSKPHHRKVKHVYGGAVPRFDACIHIDGKTGEPCGEPTVDGAHRCPPCSDRLRLSWSGPRYQYARNF